MSICEDIIAARGGVIHCGVLPRGLPSVSGVARTFGLSDDPEIYEEIDSSAALRLLRFILEEDLAYGAPLMPPQKAAELAAAFLTQFGTVGTRFYTNGDYHDAYDSDRRAWNPATSATFDTGVLVIGPHRSGCLWVEDED